MDDDKQFCMVQESPTEAGLGAGPIGAPKRSWPQWMKGEVDMRFAYVPLLACCFTTGLTDGTLFDAYGTFVSMQTGNTVFVALGTSGQDVKADDWARSLCSVGVFVMGSVFFSRLHQFLGSSPRGRNALVASFILQSICVIIASATIQSGSINLEFPARTTGVEIPSLVLIPVCLLSFQAAGQITNSRDLGIGEVPTVVITSLLCDLVSDRELLAKPGQNPKRDRRAVAFVLTVLGVICGAWMVKATGHVQSSLWLVAGIKVVITLAWLFWPGNEI